MRDRLCRTTIRCGALHLARRREVKLGNVFRRQIGLFRPRIIDLFLATITHQILGLSVISGEVLRARARFWRTLAQG